MMWYKQRYKCPKCQGLLRHSNIEDNKYVCKVCNNVVSKEKVELPKNIYKIKLGGKKR